MPLRAPGDPITEIASDMVTATWNSNSGEQYTLFFVKNIS